MPYDIRIDAEKCTRCGICVKTCPAENFCRAADDQMPEVDPTNCILCGHCVAGCPTEAITHSGLDPQAFVPRESNATAGDIEALLALKRSVRNFKSKPVEREKIEHLLRIAQMAPSDNNQQKRGYIVVTSRQKIDRLELAVVGYFKKVLLLTSKPMMTALSLLAPSFAKENGPLIPKLKAFVQQCEQGHHLVFRDAPCVVFIYGPKGNPLSRDNCLISQQYMMLQAEAMGFGSCIIGFATAARSAVEPHLNLPKGNRIYAAMTLGYPEFTIRRSVERQPPEVEWVE